MTDLFTCLINITYYITTIDINQINIQSLLESPLGKTVKKLDLSMFNLYFLVILIGFGLFQSYL